MGGFWGGRCSRSLGGRILGKTLLKKLRWEDAGGGRCSRSLGGRMLRRMLLKKPRLGLMGRMLLKKLRWEDAGEDAALEV